MASNPAIASRLQFTRPLGRVAELGRRTADICRRAIAVAFPDGLPSTPDAISAAAADFTDDMTEQLGALDTEFFQYPHNLTNLLFTFVSKHPEEFGPLPEVDDA